MKDNKLNILPNISFIIPAFNCANTIEESILSILKTNFNDGDEIIIVDDKSTDNTLQTINKIASEYGVITIIKHTINNGGAAARNTAVRNSKNKIIFCLDSDNVLEKNSVAKLNNFLISSKSDVASFGEVRYFIKDISKIHHRWRYAATIFLLDLFCSSVVPPASGNYLFTKESWVKAGGYPESAGALDTWGFGFKQLVTGAKMVTLPKSYYFHRIGYESYWVRESKDAEKISRQAKAIIAPYYDNIDNRVVDYIKNNPKSWYGNIGKIPGIIGDQTGKVLYPLKIKIRIIAKKIIRFYSDSNIPSTIE